MRSSFKLVKFKIRIIVFGEGFFLDLDIGLIFSVIEQGEQSKERTDFIVVLFLKKYDILVLKFFQIFYVSDILDLNVFSGSKLYDMGI